MMNVKYVYEISIAKHLFNVLSFYFNADACFENSNSMITALKILLSLC